MTDNPALTYQPEQPPLPRFLMTLAAMGLLLSAAEWIVLVAVFIWLCRNSQPMSAQDIARYGPLPAERLWGNVWLASTIATAALCIYLIRGSALVFRRSRAAATVMRRYARAGLCVTALGIKAAWVSTHWSGSEDISVLSGVPDFTLVAPALFVPGIYAVSLLLVLRSREVRAYYAGTVAALPIQSRPVAVPWHRRRLLRPVLLACLLVAWALVPAGAAREEDRPAWRDLLARQHRCWAYSLPPDFVVCSDDPTRFKELLASSGFIRVAYTDPPESFVGYIPPALRQFSELLVASPDLPIVFLHERKPFDSPPALVLIQVGGISKNGDAGLEAFAAPAAQLRNYRVIASPAGRLAMRCSRAPGEALTFTAGQPDPVDASHFTIGYRMGGDPGIIDGWLATSDRVMMRVRSGPARTKR